MHNQDISTYGIYNENNKMIQKEDIQKILLKGGITENINNIDLWRKAFVHKSYCKNRKKKQGQNVEQQIAEERKTVDLNKVIDIQEDSNEVLEWLGDGIIQSVVACYLIRRFPDQDEGFLTKLRSKLVKTEALCRIAKFLGFGEFILMSEHVEKACNGRNNSRILEDAFEGFVGSMAEDFGIEESCRGYMICNRFVISCIENSIDMMELIIKDDNYKDQLMRYFQRMFDGKLPKYNEDKSHDNDPPTTGGRIFYMYVTDVEGKNIGSGWAKSKKEAEQRAAKQALYNYGINHGY
jgi:ribonuclease III